MGINAIILAAGRGSRLHPYTEKYPKSLTVFGGKTLIERQVETLRAETINNIIVATGYKREMLQMPGLREAHNAKWETTNMVESLFSGEEYFTNDLIVSYGDIVYEPRVLRTLLASPHEISVIIDLNWKTYWELRFDNPLSDAESLKMDCAQRILNIGAKVSQIEEIDGQYIGLMRFQGNGVSSLRRARAHLQKTYRSWMEDRRVENAYMTDLLMEMILLGIEIHAVTIDGGWLEFDTVSDYETACAMMSDGTILEFFNPDSN
ncbi:MAG: hypothetical protein CBB68_06730 [Rhodospirillaceae bacterium TMED8]|nr:hypothetical protein [Magnetovibrio sp.]MAH85464.1 hypothetical protein [Magnetovibrio sp.]OUT47968.1 MAG: hypothetical protein CBB68_14665 [Rhodospirillaceae bacterium TMED8]OUT51310.1 MAG: hypothetical protein CBB68_06730 [Rhodospirillaceae bacterium TMED8]|tara:strand:+ start:483 stop:1271 length:789 start_codon:yes stop_codon:yes gene_type:complete